ncbi:Alpha-1B adrenergic receptor Alpha-1B adrenoreceptor [Larimichthys crocea]|uniref:Alpha-1B adrenergic receptor Alpha-1B adrenoreceptor n=1 Tax=Larimichthys crocea TaxID=215358 RepID=A0A0F8AHQ5_LARCR|nr:alpha-1A adrenergic receptor isoform X1 [Larimichthys crocea]XP_019124940.1 alpha-1A adrenergic receptor isoform X1 [Larimichthys crocea]KAE8287817.1 Alpha-1B adrenergic receptor Alpha-1B adrenoreceptor [Larimichthys crocea]
MSLWTNGSSEDLYAGTQPPLSDSNSSINRTDSSQHRGHHGTATLDLSRAVPVGMVLASFIMFAIVGNILVILSVVCNRHLRIPTNYFIINLAIADLLLGTTVLPVSATLEVLDYWVFGRIFCDIWAAVDVLCCTASIMSLCVISIDRYIGVRYPLQYPMIVTEKRALLAMLGVWILAIVISIGPLLGWKQAPSKDDTVCLITEEPFYALFSSLGSFYIPLAVILAMYCRVYIVAKRTTKNLEAGMMKERQEDSNELTLRIHCRNQQIQDLCSTSKSRSSAGRSTLTVKLLKFSREKKAAKTLGVVVGMFILCWLPFFLALPIGSFNSSLRPPETFFKVIFWLGYFNSCLNPIIYPCYSREFKQAFIRILRCRWKRKRQGWQAYYNYRCQQGSNNSSFLNGSQQTLSSISPSPRCVTSRLRPPAWPSSTDRDLLPGTMGRGRLSPVSPLAKDAGMASVIYAGRGVVVNGRNMNKEEVVQSL